MTDQRWLRIVAVSFVMYTIAFIDRTNLSMALPSMSRALHMDPKQAGDAVGIFFWGYLLFQVPGAYLAQRWSAKKVVAILLVLWAFCAMATGLVRDRQELLAVRFALGLAEGAVWPAVLVLVAHWFRRAERARANAYWMLCLPAAVVVSAPLSGWLLTHWDWRVLLIVEGALPFLWLVVWLWGIDDYPRNADWISPEERDRLEAALEQEARELKLVKSEGYLTAMLRPQVIFLVVIYFTRNFGSYGSLFWLPSAVEKAKKMSDLTVGWLVTIPYILTIIAMVLLARSSDRTRERRGHLSAALAWSGLFFIGALAISDRSPLVSFAMLSVAIAGVYASLGPFWALPSETLPRKILAPAMGLINAIGNLGGYFGPLMVGYFAKRSGGFVWGFGGLAAVLLVGAALAFALRPAEVQPSPQPSIVTQAARP